ncbi:uncharacterized protein LOC116105564 isoform X1 [Pistacia vera]|uniref:uncharacterized protein LOC116105564 isoform X1 n=2 Tax=Pistacia vera TaxID=55513 RepID=UPI001262B151|nr:uncharacterized protein LOC116105564 isoform X1 [Pistacia vera]XP_031247824.1 uncharacterized protein LOC116105564 isoform X1 [Pistacia vera]
MVCSVGSGRMAVMARLLEVGRFSPNRADEVTHQKLAAQNIYRELRQADEANLLDEEDMHVFGLKPMADSLHLVCCNACKKPVKASQYAAHAELCRSLNATGEPMLDVYSGTGNRKPPRKERKKLLTAYASILFSFFHPISISLARLIGHFTHCTCCLENFLCGPFFPILK